MHVRGWSWRRWRYECRSCRLHWRGTYERCQGQPFDEAYPTPAKDREPAFGWNGPTLVDLPLMTRGGQWRAGGER